VGRIDRGLLALVGVEGEDTAEDVQYVAGKIRGLRIFPDVEGKMNRDVRDAGGAVLVVSQFTLLGDVRRGRRPSFITAAPPEAASQLVEELVAALARMDVRVATGEFQAHMEVDLLNDGPVTILVDSRRIF
jgi:D-tyrosyl-tRNA(Tyr) deacylase